MLESSWGQRFSSFGSPTTLLAINFLIIFIFLCVEKLCYDSILFLILCLSCAELLTEYNSFNLSSWNLELYFSHLSLQVLVCGWMPLWYDYRQFLHCFGRTAVLNHTSNDVMVVAFGVCIQEMWYQVLAQTQSASSSLGGNVLFFFRNHYYNNALTFRG